MKPEKIHSELNHAIEDLYLINSKQTVATDELIQLIKQHVFGLSKELFITSKLENYYWEFSSFSIYEAHYSKRLDDYLIENDNEQLSETDFINNEISSFNSLEKKWYVDLFEKDTLSQIQKSFKKKKLFLSDKLESLEFEILDSADFIDIGKISAKEKMIYLYKLGVIDFLLEKQPFRSTANPLASALCSILEEKQSTIQPIISAIVNGNLANKNHPLYTESTEKKVNQQLINIGFNLKETN
jgi:hypothetical protein